MISTLGATVGGSSLGATVPIAGQVATGVQQFRNAAPHNTATKFVNDVEGPFGASLAEVARLGSAGQANQAKQLFESSYAKYMEGVDYYKNFGMDNLKVVAEQSLNNPKLWQTVQTMAGQLGFSLGPNKQLIPVSQTMPADQSVQLNDPIAPPAQGTAPSVQSNGYVEGDNNPALTGSNLNSTLSSLINIIPGILGNIPGMNGKVGNSGPMSSPTNPTAPVAPTSSKSIFDSLLPAILLGTSVGSNIYTSNRASDAAIEAAKIQATSADKAAAMADATKNRELDLNKSIYDQNLLNAQPWLKQGTAAINELGTRLALPGSDNTAGNYGDLSKPFGEKFSFTADDLLKDPGYLNRLSESQKAMQRAASAKGALFTPGTQAVIDAKIGEQASNEYGSAHDRQLNEFLKRYDIYNNDQNTAYNRLAGVAGTGQAAVGQLGSAGSQYGTNSGNIDLSSTRDINDLLTSGSSATAQGLVNSTAKQNAGLTNSIDDITSYINELVRSRRAVV